MNKDNKEEEGKKQLARNNNWRKKENERKEKKYIGDIQRVDYQDDDWQLQGQRS